MTLQEYIENQQKELLLFEKWYKRSFVFPEKSNFSDNEWDYEFVRFKKRDKTPS